ncbi:hypothetical protein HHI36_023606 [Cryptolaemus montrouzieri]|uniref:Uncharacterized protein n=1 Tax=Cryptolaemus montrouzieri TaxID=559131 RepID=A0ABD2PHS1_9CUCU
MSHSNHSSTGQIKTLLKESSWITCKVKETEIMMRKLSIKECESSVTEPFERLNFTDIAIPEKKETQNEKSSVSFTFPLGVDEELCCEEEEKNEKKNYNPKDWIIVSLVSNDYSDTVNKNKYRNVVTLFINHVLNSEKKTHLLDTKVSHLEKQ